MNEFVDLKIGNAFNKCTVLRVQVLQKKNWRYASVFSISGFKKLEYFYVALKDRAKSLK